jgi:hypothetical protein
MNEIELKKKKTAAFIIVHQLLNKKKKNKKNLGKALVDTIIVPQLIKKR